MIEEFVESWYKNKDNLRKSFESHHPGDYKEIVALVTRHILKKAYSKLGRPDYRDIRENVFGSRLGDQVYVIPSDDYTQSKVWAVAVRYGSCSSCDALAEIQGDLPCEGKPTKTQVDDYMSLALHIVQGVKSLVD